MRVLVIREFDAFSRMLMTGGVTVINCPTIRTVPMRDLSDLDTKLARIDTFDGIFLTSRKATEIFRRKLRENELSFRGKVYVFGRRSVNLLRRDGMSLYTSEMAGTVREFLQTISPADLTGKRFLVVCGKSSPTNLVDYLSTKASVERTIVYSTQKVAAMPAIRNEIRNIASNGEIAFACFFSPSGAAGFFDQFRHDILDTIKIAVIGRTTADYFVSLGKDVDFMAEKPTAVDFARGLLQFHNRAVVSKSRNSAI